MSINSLPELGVEGEGGGGLVKVLKYEVTVIRLNPQLIKSLSTNPTNWSNTLKQFVRVSVVNLEHVIAEWAQHLGLR